VNLSFTNDIYTPTLVLSGSYAANELFKIITKDENHDGTSASDHTTEEFKDKQGRVILRRTFNNETKHDTYYVYDDYGNLTYVLPPKSEPDDALPNSTELDELCYQYKYDVRNRLIEKKVPGKKWESIVYNNLDQPILTQDSVLKNENKWLFTKYDAFGRVAYTGLDSLNTVSRTTMQTSANATSLQSVTRTTSANTNGDTSMYYNNDAYPSSYDEIHTINYYDTYVDLPAGLSSTVTTYYGLTSSTDTQSLPTVSKVRVLSTNNWITTVSYYDSKGRSIYVYTTNPYLGTTDIVETDLDFTGKPEQIKTSHTKGSITTTTLEVFTYDHTGRVTKQTHKINSGNEEVIAQNTYDGMGQLKNKKVGNTVAIPLQTIDYTYNVRGWLKQINNPASLGSDLFAYKLNYNTVNHSGTKLFNGNIAETEWKTASDNTLRWYRYGYDDLNRISSAINNSSNYNLTSVSYDKNGNITNLTRKGQINSGATSFGDMDVLVYTYQQNGVSNQLEKVLDNGNDTYGFKDGVNQTIEYTYDDNGNLKTDDNKGITSITYNHLNLPTQINFGSSNKIEYFYDATGVKLKKKVTENSTITTTDYANGFVYENSALQFFGTSEGYIEPNGSNFDYIYQFKDHLDNIRLSYYNTGTTTSPSLVIKEEHNFYPFGLKHKGYNAAINGTHHKYMFGSKEYDESFQSLNTYDFGARNYDPTLGRWMNIDPLAELMRRHSPYNYAFNNPIFFIDPDGMSPTISLLGGDTITQEDVQNSSFGFQQITGGLPAVVSSGGGKLKDEDPPTKYQQYFRAQSTELEQEVANSGFAQDNDLGPEWVSYIPVIGSSRDAYRDYQNGDYGWAAFNTVMAISDVFLVKSLFVAGGKIAMKTAFKTGSHTWKATRAWLGRTGQAAKGQDMHHWLLNRNQGIGKYFSNQIKNQPWNLMNMPSKSFHQAVHGVGPNSFTTFGRFWFGTPTWFKATGIYGINLIENGTR